jgi:hypothetical protein
MFAISLMARNSLFLPNKGFSEKLISSGLSKMLKIIILMKTNPITYDFYMKLSPRIYPISAEMQLISSSSGV